MYRDADITIKLVAEIPTIVLLTIAVLYKNVSKHNQNVLFFEFVYMYILITGNVAYIKDKAYQKRKRCGLICEDKRPVKLATERNPKVLTC